jgi:hypothetical protein
MSRGVAVRPSQFVLTYGVGSILEAPNGPRMVLGFEHWGGLFNSPNLQLELRNNYQIPEENLSALLGGGRIFRLPTNSDLLEKDETPIFRTAPFPTWAHCQDHNIIYRLRPDGRTRCPQCDPARHAQDQAMRFVSACPRGHLDDVNWKGIVHGADKTCDSELFRWVEEGSTLSDIRIICMKCSAETSLSQVYYGKHRCSGRLPESLENEHCNEIASVSLRNASNLRVSVVESVLTIPPRDTRIGRILENPYLHSILALALKSSWSKKKIVDQLTQIQGSVPGLDPLTIEEMENTPEELFFKTVKEVISSKQPRARSSNEIRDAELEALQDAALRGHPPDSIAGAHDFEVDKDSVDTFALSKNTTLRAAPVNRLRVVMAQRGYKRIIGDGPHTTRETFLRIGQERWYVGVEQRGEGIFIDIPPDESLHITNSTDGWATEFKRSRNLNYHPVFIWWHTLSHRIIKALALDSGYSSASIRERVYLRHGNSSKGIEGAVLLYTSQRGGDGTLGGLIALVPDFDRVLSAALRDIDSCSNDPLCMEQEVSQTRNNGAACYACLFTSETSCEFDNSFLDRNLLRLNLE